MTEEISWQVELELGPERLDEFRALTAEMVKATQAEPGAPIYERFASPDLTTVWVYERYADSGAAVDHLKTFATQFGQRFGRLVTRRSFTVFGSPSVALRRILDGLGATYHDRLAGFSRC